MLKIGNLTLSSPYILAPLSGVSDLPYRIINREFGCELAFIEMISARALVYESPRTQKRLITSDRDKPLGIQLLGTDAQYIQEAMDIIQEYKFDIIDFNAACPVKKVTNRGEGASLLKHPKRINELLKIIKNKSKIPVTVKIRAGWDLNTQNAKDIALYAQDAGIDALFIHGRTKQQLYNGNVDYNIIREIKEALAIPIIASGDILTPFLVKRMFDETGCDGVLIARGSFGNPWIFREASEYQNNGIIPKRPSAKEITNIMLKHFYLCCDNYGEKLGCMIFRKFFIWYTKGFNNIKPLRYKVFKTKLKDQMRNIIKEISELKGPIQY